MEEQGAPAMTYETDFPDSAVLADRAVPAGNPASGDTARSGDTAARSGGTSPSGEPRVDAALRSLDTLPSRPVDEHPAVFEQVHASLVEVLGELRSDIGPADTGP